MTAQPAECEPVYHFSTEIRASYLELDNRQIPVGGTDFGEIRVELADVDVYLGADDSRHANKLDYDLAGFRAAGVTRLSLGAQSMADAELQRLGRRHRATDVGVAVRAARAAGIDAISLDLLTDIPGQSLDSWRSTLHEALAQNDGAFGAADAEDRRFDGQRCGGGWGQVDRHDHGNDSPRGARHGYPLG